MSDDETEIVPPAGVTIKEGPHGRGVYAAREIAAGETIEIVPTIEIGDSDAGGLLADYVLYSNRDPNQAVFMLGYGSLYNHSGDANAEYVEHDEDQLAFNALRNIAPGEEITIDYGDDWWQTREREPG